MAMTPEKEKALHALMLQAAELGLNKGDITKLVAGMAKSGEIKSAGRGKIASDDPFRKEILAVFALAACAAMLDKVEKYLATPDKDNTTPVSLAVKLSDNLSVNFIKKVKRVQKKKTAQPALGEANGSANTPAAEPTLA